MADVVILGIRGVPNRYGGFERLVEVLAPYLASRGHTVTVVCEADSGNAPGTADMWQGVRRSFVRVGRAGPASTLAYDFRSFSLVPAGAVALIFGYGTAVFQPLLRMRRIPHAVNMDGIEWQRAKWGRIARLWLRANERVATKMSDEIIADHPEIQAYLAEFLGVRSTMIPYGASIEETAGSGDRDHPLLIRSRTDGYFLLIARPEPENQVHVVLDAYRDSRRRFPFWVVGDFTRNAYGQNLIARHPEVVFVGPIYSAGVLHELRRNCSLYFHGHSVGGTNPSLVEAMAAGALICAHDNIYNRWVLEDGGVYFRTAQEAIRHMDDESLQANRADLVATGQKVCARKFQWTDVLAAYEQVIARLDPTRRSQR